MLFFDPVAGLDASELLAGFSDGLRCPITGAAASQPWTPMATTFQYFGGEVFDHGAVALALDGPFEVVVGASHGTEPIGVQCEVTRHEGTMLLDIYPGPAFSWPSNLIVLGDRLFFTTRDVTQVSDEHWGTAGPPEGAGGTQTT